MHERRSFQPDIDKGCLHPGQDPGDFTQDDVAYRAALIGALDLQFGDDAVLDEGDARLAQIAIDDQGVTSHESLLSVDPARGRARPALVI
jgi:hypothetical protein